MSTDFHERTQIMAISQWIGQWAWVVHLVPGYFYDPDCLIALKKELDKYQ